MLDEVPVRVVPAGRQQMSPPSSQVETVLVARFRWDDNLEQRLHRFEQALGASVEPGESGIVGRRQDGQRKAQCAALETD